MKEDTEERQQRNADKYEVVGTYVATVRGQRVVVHRYARKPAQAAFGQTEYIPTAKQIKSKVLTISETGWLGGDDE